MKPTLNIVAIGIAAGVVAAIMSIGSVVQNALSYVLLLLSPLPILLAGLGWGPVAAAVSVIACGVAIAGVAGPMPALVLVLTTALPSAIAAYLCGMGRTDDGRSEWYPLGLILLLVALAVATGFVISGYAIGYNAAFVEEFAKELTAQLSQSNAEFASNPAAAKQFVDFIVATMPFFQPASWLLIIVANLWLALVIARRSALLQRAKDDWPEALHLPVAAVGLLALMAFGAMFSKSLGMAILAYAGTLSMAFTVTGFALLHTATRGKTWRHAALWFSYCATLFFGLAPLFLIAGLYRSVKNSASNGSQT
ncbi:MAG: DUF2232 domain-containing protein [Rhizobiaceae bacterium]